MSGASPPPATRPRGALAGHGDAHIHKPQRHATTTTPTTAWRELLRIPRRSCNRYVTGELFGHNKVPPYHDNDFEVFIDVR